MSVRLRLTLWYVALLLLMLVAAGAAIWRESQQVGLASLDTTLTRNASRVAATLVRAPTLGIGPGAPDELALQTPLGNLWVRVLDGHGRVAAWRGTPAAWLNTQVLTTAGTGASKAKVRQAGGDIPVRIYVLPVVQDGHRIATVQVLADLRTLQDISARDLRAVGHVALPALVVALVGGLFLADRALRPVGRITRLAAQIGTGDLHRRVGPANGRASTKPRPNDELERLAATFDAMLTRLEHAQVLQRQLVADAAHQLCTPVATIAANAEITLSRARTSDEYQEAMDHVLAETHHLGRLVDDLLLLAHVEAGGLETAMEPVEIDEICRQAIAAVLPLAQAENVELHATIPTWPLFVRGDDLALSQLMRNLLDNAIRHTPEQGSVNVQVDETADTVVVRVCDTGPGIPETEREQVFRRFYRSTNAGLPGRRGGSGLGLAICRAIVEAHGGTIHAEDAAGGGAQIVVRLPKMDRSGPIRLTSGEDR